MKKSTTSILVLILLFTSIISLAQDQGLIIRQGHTSAINVVTYSPDGKFVISASNDNTIKMWDVKSGIDIKTFAGHTSAVKCIEMSADAKTILSGDNDGNIMVWDMHGNGKPKKSIKAHEGGINVIKLFPDGKSYLSGGEDMKVKKWAFASGELEKTYDILTSSISSLAINPNQKVAVIGGKKANDVDLVILDLEKNEITDDALKNIKGAGAAKAYTMAIMGGIAAASNIAKGNTGKDMMTIYVFTYSNMEFSKDGQSLLISQNLYLPVMAAKGDEEKNGNTMISILEFEDEGKKFKEVRRPKRWSLGYPNARAVFNADQTQIIVNHKLSLRVYDMVTAEFPDGSIKEATNYEPPLIKEFTGNVAWLNSIAISPDYKTVVSADDNQSIKLWDMNTGRIFRNLEGFAQPALAVAAMPDGKHIVVGTKGRNLTQWDITTGRMVRNFDRSADVNSIDVNSNGSMIATTSLNSSYFKVWNANTGRMFKSILEKDREFNWVKFSGNDNELYANSFNTATGIGLSALKSDQELKLYNTVDNKSKKLKETIDQLETKYQSGAYKVTWDGYNVKLLENGKAIIEDEQVGVVTDACFTADTKYLITTNTRGEIAMYDIAKKRKIVSMSLIGEYDYIAYTPDFYYTSSKNAANAIAFKSGLTVLPFEQLELKFNRPDIVADRIGYSNPKLVASYKAAFEKRLKRLGLTEKDLEGKLEVPEVTIANLDNIPLSVEKPNFSFSISAKDDSYGISNVQVFINDVPLYKGIGMEAKSAKGQAVSKEINLALSTGINEIKVVATNTNGLESIPASFEIKYERAEYYKPNLYLAAIGVSQYQQSTFNLTFAAKDAKDINALLSQSAAFENKYTKVLTDQQATKDNILGLRSFLQQASVDDVVVIFIAGHGVLDKSFNYYFATHDMDFNNPANGGLPYEALEDLLADLKCRNKLVFMDTCHSGELDKDDVVETTQKASKTGKVAFRSAGTIAQLKENSFGLSNTLELSKTLFGDMKKGTGATIISAAGGTEFAAEGLNSANGLFTASLLDGIQSRRADVNRNRSYTVSELMNYISEQVVTLSNGMQIPTSREENVKNDFRVY